MKELLENVENREMETERDDNVRAKISGNRADTGFRVVTWLAKRLTRYAFKIAYEQFVASGNCEVSSPNDDSLPSIVRYDGKETPDAEVAADSSCNCRWSRFHGLPCRHIFAVAKGKNPKTLPDSAVLPRWSVPADASTTALIRHHENAALIHYVDYNKYMQTCSKLF